MAAWKISNGHIPGTGRPIDFVSDPRMGFSGTADRMALFPVAPNPRFGRPPSWKISNDHKSVIRSAFMNYRAAWSNSLQEKIMREE